MNKKVSNSRERLLQLMEYYGINQTELCKRTGLQKSALSNYLNGDREPRQAQISLIADPFNINPAWLMGYDVPMILPTINANLNVDTQKMSEALSMFEAYQLATPEIRTAIDSLLKTVKPVVDSLNSIVPAVENFQDQMRPVANNMQKIAQELPHLKGMKPAPELPHLKKDSDK